MIRYLYGDQLAANPTLAKSMFTDRAAQFSKRLQWPVQVDESGCERDKYDTQNPLYVIWQLKDGSHGGSMRFLPTTGPVMVNDHFQHLTDGGDHCQPLDLGVHAVLYFAKGQSQFDGGPSNGGGG